MITPSPKHLKEETNDVHLHEDQFWSFNGVKDKKFFTVLEASKFLSLSRSKLYQLMDTGKLNYYKFEGARRISITDLKDFVLRSHRPGIDG